MSEAYLVNGERVEIIEELPQKRFLVSRLYWDENDIQIPDTYNTFIVGKVYEAPPTQVFHNEIGLLKKEIDDLQKIKRELMQEKRDLEQIQKQKTDFSKHIFNLNEIRKAKRITAFPDRNITPIEFSEKQRRGLKISISLTIRTGEKRTWVYQLYDEYDSFSEYVDPDYGLICDATDEEILRIARERADKKETWNNGVIERTPDKYLTEALIEKKRQIKEQKKQEEIAKLKAKIEGAQDQLNKIVSV